MSGHALFAIVIAVFLFGLFAKTLLYVDFSTAADSGDLLYDGEVRVGVRRSTKVGYSPVTTMSGGFLPIEIRGTTIRLGDSTGIARWPAAALGHYHRLEAARFEAAREWIDQPPLSFVSRSGEGVVLRGQNHRGWYLDFTLRPRDGNIVRLLDALVAAGARAR